MARKSPKNIIGNFEASLEQLERLIEELEAEDTSLEDSLKAFEAGVKLTRSAQKALAEAEQKIRVLVEKDGSPIEEVFDDDEKEDG